MCNIAIAKPETGRTMPQLFSVVASFALLAAFDLAFRVSGLRGAYWIIDKVDVSKRSAAGTDNAKSICRDLELACRYYFREALCLQRSAAATCLLRLCGIPAVLTIGIRKYPFMAHAWVEASGVRLYADPYPNPADYNVIDQRVPRRSVE